MFALALFSCKSYKPASGNPYYKPLKEFKGDTLAYFNYNFKEHKDFYIALIPQHYYKYNFLST